MCVMFSPAGFFSALCPRRQQHHRQHCQPQGSEPQHPRSTPCVPADHMKSANYSGPVPTNGKALVSQQIYTGDNIAPMLLLAPFKGADKMYSIV